MSNMINMDQREVLEQKKQKQRRVRVKAWMTKGSVPTFYQVFGICSVIGALYLLTGFAWALLAAGVVILAVGIGKEAGVI
jgi:uncharacterized membrane protein YkgB